MRVGYVKIIPFLKILILTLYISGCVAALFTIERNSSLESGFNRSSASIQSIQLPEAYLIDSLRAAEKSPFQSNVWISALYFLAMSIVLSVDPVSTIIISSTTSATLCRHSANIFSSFLTIMQRDNFLYVIRVLYFVDFLYEFSIAMPVHFLSPRQVYAVYTFALPFHARFPD